MEHKNEPANVSIPPGPRPQRQTAREWMKQTGEFGTELFAACGEEMYSEIMAAMSEFGEYVESFFPVAAPSSLGMEQVGEKKIGTPEGEVYPDWGHPSQTVEEIEREIGMSQPANCRTLSTVATKQEYIDISNLRFYSAMAKKHEWGTDIIHFGVIEQTLNEIADRLEQIESLRRSGAPESVKLVSNRVPTEDEIKRGLELEPMAKECLERNKQRTPATAPAQPEPISVRSMAWAAYQVLGCLYGIHGPARIMNWFCDVAHGQVRDMSELFPITAEERAKYEWNPSETTRAGAHNGQGWAQDAFVMLAGLKEAVKWELAPAIMKEIRRLVDTFPAPPDGQGAKNPATNAISFKEHTQHVQQFLNDLWAFSIDPLHEGMDGLKVAQVCAALLKAAKDNRDSVYEMEGLFRTACLWVWKGLDAPRQTLESTMEAMRKEYNGQGATTQGTPERGSNRNESRNQSR